MKEEKQLINNGQQDGIYDLRGFVYTDIMEECGKFELPEQVRYLKYVLHKWDTERPRLDPNGTLVPKFEERTVREIENRIEEIERKEKEKQLWYGTKGEFAEFVSNEYLKNEKAYLSERDASIKLFNKYRFNFEWTEEKCYGMVRKR